jgi:hypothetical protein
VLWGSSSAVLRESSSAVLWGSSSAELWGSSRAVLWGSSSAVLRESSSAVLWESSSAESFGYTILQIHGGRAKAIATETVSVNLWDGATCEGGRQQVVKLESPTDWCCYYGARIVDDCAVLFKAVRDDYRSHHGVEYQPGSMPEDPKWDGKKGECRAGGGLNFSPSPRAAKEFDSNAVRFLECHVKLTDIVVHFGKTYPEKVTAKGVAKPLVEVDIDGESVGTVQS